MKSLNVRKKYWLLVPFFLIVDVGAILVSAWMLYTVLTGVPYFQVILWSTSFLVIFMLVFFWQISLFKKGDKEADFYIDLRSPVFRIQGAVIKQLRKSKNSPPNYSLFVRGQKFTRENYADIERFFNSIDEGNEVAVEYSPRTKYVWKIYKTEDI